MIGSLVIKYRNKERDLFKNSFVFLILILIVMVLYIQTFFGYFQQDEWLAFARFVQLKDLSLIEKLQYAFSPSSGNYIPFSILTIYLLYSVFKLNYIAYIFLSLTLHTVIAYLVFTFSKRFFKDNWKAFFTSLLFVVSAAGYQANTWVMADIPIHLASILGLLSMIYFWIFLENKKSKDLYTSLFLLIGSLLFKEILFGMFMIYPMIILLFDKRRLNTKVKQLLIILFFGIIFLCIRIVSYLLKTSSGVDESLIEPSLVKTIYNFATVPLRSLIQTIVPPEIIITLSRIITRFLPDVLTGKVNTPQFDIFVLKRTFEVVNGFFAIILLMIIFLLIRIKQDKNLRNHIFFGLVFVFLNSLVFAFTPERVGIVSVIDSRHLYLQTFGVAILIIAFVIGYLGFGRRAIFLLFIIGILNVFWLNSNLSTIRLRGEVRKSILSQIHSYVPKLNKKTIFYTESDKSYYGLSEDIKILPFQSGFGQTLLAYYYPSENFPTSFYKNRYLWEITSQGYKEFDDRGFGYFRDFNEMAGMIKNKGLSPDIVLGFRYDSTTEVVHDITTDVRGRILSFLSPKKIIEQSEYSLMASENNPEVVLMLDRNLESFWQSANPYDTRHNIIVTFKGLKEIAMLRINVKDNRDQNKIGYRIMSSEDGKRWRQVFYSISVPPSSEGIVDVYFQPHKAMNLEIDQIGSHKYAKWVINELELYEVI